MSMIPAIGQSSDELRGTYLKLLLTQLRNQSPLNPTDTSEMTSQLAQLSELQQLETINRKFDDVLTAAELNHGRSLIGSQVTFVPEGADEPVQARVDSAEVAEGELKLRADGHEFALDDIQAVGGSSGWTLAEELTRAASLIGKEIRFVLPPEGPEAAPTTATGTVDSVTLDHGRVRLHVGENAVELASVQSIEN